MLKNLSKKNKIILISMLVIPIVFILFLLLLKGCSGSSLSYENYQKKMISAAKSYVEEHKLQPKNEGGIINVDLDKLIDNGYINDYKKSLKEESCTGNVSVRNNGVSVKGNKGGYLIYIPDLKCDKYKTKHLIDVLKKDIVTEKSGLYQYGNGYIYKGLKVNNYVSFYDDLYRIISIDENNILKLVKIEAEDSTVMWDNKYNNDIMEKNGKNDYSDSYIIDVLSTLYLNTKEDKKKHLIGYNVCYGNRSLDNTDINNIQECELRLPNQFYSLMSTYEYPMASYDKDCTSINSGACTNYNYLYDSLSNTWLINGVKDNSYEVYYYSSGYIDYVYANYDMFYNVVIYLDGNELFTKGNGSLKSPYVIK